MLEEAFPGQPVSSKLALVTQSKHNKPHLSGSAAPTRARDGRYLIWTSFYCFTSEGHYERRMVYSGEESAPPIAREIPRNLCGVSSALRPIEVYPSETKELCFYR